MRTPDDDNWTPCDHRHGHAIVNHENEIVTTPILFDSIDPEDHEYAKTRYCDHCPFLEWCDAQKRAAWDTAHYKHGTQYSGPVGTWAGQLIRPRKNSSPDGMPHYTAKTGTKRAPRGKLGPPVCGTRRGYDHHKRQGQNPCDACRIASNEARHGRRETAA